MRPLIPVLLVALVACGGDDDTSTGASDRTTTSTSTTSSTIAGETTTTTGGGGSDVHGAISLTVEVNSDGTALRSGTLTCGDTASGTSYLADPAAAQAACDLVRDNAEAVRRLVDGPDTDRICTMQYGGPEVAKVTGTIDGTEIDATINRTDGCAIADWTLLEPLIGPPGA
jgi:hypothetical protein